MVRAAGHAEVGVDVEAVRRLASQGRGQQAAEALRPALEKLLGDMCKAVRKKGRKRKGGGGGPTLSVWSVVCLLPVGLMVVS